MGHPSSATPGKGSIAELLAIPTDVEDLDERFSAGNNVLTVGALIRKIGKTKGTGLAPADGATTILFDS